jgi:hypothetical protein
LVRDREHGVRGCVDLRFGRFALRLRQFGMTVALSDGPLVVGRCLRHAFGMTSSDAKPSRRGAIIGLLFFVIGVPIAVWLLYLVL